MKVAITSAISAAFKHLVIAEEARLVDDANKKKKVKSGSNKKCQKFFKTFFELQLCTKRRPGLVRISLLQLNQIRYVSFGHLEWF